MKVGIITDTHDLHDILDVAVDAFSQHQVDYVLHAGDITSPSTAEALASIENAKFIGVFGNCDIEKSSLEAVIRGRGGEIQRGTYKGNIQNKKVLMAHDPRAFGSMPLTDDFDLIVYGHTHIQEIRRQGDTLVINPGQGWTVILELESMEYETVNLA
jgi:hypothetical protein